MHQEMRTLISNAHCARKHKAPMKEAIAPPEKERRKEKSISQRV